MNVIRKNLFDIFFRFDSFLLLCIFISLPLYLLPSGVPQISHYLCVLLAAVLFFQSNFVVTKSNQLLFAVLLFLSIYLIVRQLVFVLNYQYFESFLGPLYFLFNVIWFFTFLSFFNAHGQDLTLKIAAIGISLGLGVAWIFLIFKGFSFFDTTGVDEVIQGEGLQGGSQIISYRVSGSFNNPNQLGYYSLSISGIFVYLFLKKIISLRSFVVLFFLSAALSAASLSKAAMISIIFYLLIFLSSDLKKEAKQLFILILPIVMIALYYIPLENLKFIDRLLSIGSANDDNLLARGYYLIGESKYLIFTGAGYGWDSLVSTYRSEIHSTFINFLVSWGIFSFILLLVFLYVLFYRLFKNYGFLIAFSIMGPSMMYGVTHNGIRFTAFWTLLAIFASLNANKINR